MTTSGRRYPAQRLSPRPGAGRPLLSGSRASAPRAPLTKQAIRTSRYPGAIFSLTARCTFDRYEGRCRRVGYSPPLLASAEAPAPPSSSSGGPPATSMRAEYLATELLPRGCYFDPLDLPLRTAVGHWDPDNAIFRCAMVCTSCRARACNRRMWYKLDDHDSHLCDSCKDYQRWGSRTAQPNQRKGGRPQRWGR